MGTITSGTTETVTIVMSVPPGTSPSGVPNTASVTSTTADPDPTNNEATYTTDVTAQADLEVSKVAGTASVIAGDQMTWTVSIKNLGPSTATAVTATDDLPASLSLVSATPSVGSCTGTTTISCALGSIAPGDTVTIDIVTDVSPDTPAGPLSNVASATSATIDPTASNNTDSDTVDVARDADLSVQKVGPDAPTTAGSDFDAHGNAHHAHPCSGKSDLRQRSERLRPYLHGARQWTRTSGSYRWQ